MKSTSRKPRKILIVSFGLVLAAVALLALYVASNAVFAFNRAFGGITPGMSETQVLAHLGVPDERSAKFKLAQRHGFEKEYERAAKSSSEYYLLWHRYIDTTYTIGFDKSGNVTMKAAGGT